MSLSAMFYNRPTLDVAHELLGKTLVRAWQGHTLRAKIVEVEAYIGEQDSACHASKGRTPRTEVMFGTAGRAYVYLVYGMHHMLNIVTEADGFPAAVLIRAVEPLAGAEAMAALRGHPPKNLTNGPARLCQALGITRSQNGLDITASGNLWIEDAPAVPPSDIAAGPRIGIGYASPADQRAPWRLWIKHNPYLSR